MPDIHYMRDVMEAFHTDANTFNDTVAEFASDLDSRGVVDDGEVVVAMAILAVAEQIRYLRLELEWNRKP